VLCETVIFHRIAPPSIPVPQKRELRAVSVDQSRGKTKPLPEPKTAARQPTQADFEAFLKERGATSISLPAAEQDLGLFREFMAWRSKQ
jgi:hypothetical protein